MNEIYDLVIIGAGPAGYTASIYASRYKMSNVIIGEMPGGVITESHKVCNFPTEEEISGLELAVKMQKHAKNLGASEIFGRVTKIEKKNDNFVISTADKIVEARTVIFATGLERRRLDAPGEKDFIGKGVAYCATCDAMFFKNKVVAVLGGGDAATTAAIYLAEVATKVYQIYRGSGLKGEISWIELAERNEKIELILNTNVVEIRGEAKVESITLDREYVGKNTLAVDGVFVEIGSTPKTELASSVGVESSAAGYIKVDGTQSTNVPGVYAAGDITTASNGFKQVITACSEGAVAAESIYKFLQQNKNKQELKQLTKAHA